MAAAAEVIQTPPLAEEYAHSLWAIRNFGKFVVEQTLQSPEGQSTQELTYQDFQTALGEMLKTDVEFRGFLDINNKRKHEILDNKVCAEDGTPLEDLIGNGIATAKAAAKRESGLQFQVVRDGCDGELIGEVERLRPGEALVGLSMDPKKAFREQPKICKKLGYREGLAYAQWFVRVDENTLVAGSYSIDKSDETIWRNLLAEYDLQIPEDESSDTWLKHTIKLQASAEQTESFTENLRAEYYQRIGVTEPRSSVSAYVEAYDPLVRQFFDAYYPAVARALYTGENNEFLQSFASALLRTDTSRYKPEDVSQLMRIANSKKFDGEGAKLIDSLIRYAVVEELRKGLKQALDTRRPGYTAPLITSDFQVPAFQELSQQHMNKLLVQNVEIGVRAGRSYGGCPGQIEFDNLTKSFNPQEAFGGRGGGRKKAREANEAITGIIRCIKCRKFVPKKEVVKKDCWECPKCTHKVDICSGKVEREGIVDSDDNSRGIVAIIEKLQANRRKQEQGVANAV